MLSNKEFKKVVIATINRLDRTLTAEERQSLRSHVKDANLDEALVAAKSWTPSTDVKGATTTNATRHFDLGDPYETLRARSLLLKDYLEKAGSSTAIRGIPENMPNPGAVYELLDRIDCKPNVVLSGAFDVGKSTIINWMMDSGDCLPTKYQPTTAIITFIRHVRDKPAWLADDAVILKRGFDTTRWRDHKHVRQNQVASGSIKTLFQYGTQ